MPNYIILRWSFAVLEIIWGSMNLHLVTIKVHQSVSIKLYLMKIKVTLDFTWGFLIKFKYWIVLLFSFLVSIELYFRFYRLFPRVHCDCQSSWESLSKRFNYLNYRNHLFKVFSCQSILISLYLCDNYRLLLIHKILFNVSLFWSTLWLSVAGQPIVDDKIYKNKS